MPAQSPTARVRVARSDEAAALAELAAATFPLACPPHTSAEAITDFIRTVLAAENFASYLAAFVGIAPPTLPNRCWNAAWPEPRLGSTWAR